MSLRLGLITNDKLKSVYVNTFDRDSMELIFYRLRKYSQQELSDLLDLGDINHLDESVAKTRFYHRDMGEELELCEPVIEDNVTTWEDIDTDRSPVDYYIVMKDNKLKITECFGRKWLSLKQWERWRLNK